MEKPNINEKVKNILTTDIKFLIAVVMFVIGVVGPYYQIKEDIALIKKDIATINSNHEAHIQDITKNIEEIKKIDQVQNDRMELLQQQLIKMYR